MSTAASVAPVTAPQRSTPFPDPESERWVAELGALGGPGHDAALARLHDLLLREQRGQAQRRRRRAGEPISGTDTASSSGTDTASTETGTDAEALPAPAGDTGTEERPARAPRVRRRLAPATEVLFSDGSAAFSDSSAAEVETPAPDAAEADSADETSRAPRRRRRSARGSRGAADAPGADAAVTPDAPIAADMTGGSEAGVGTTAD